MLKLKKFDTYSILTVNDVDFKISKELTKFIEETNSLNDEVIELMKSKNNVITLKIKSLNYSIVDSNKNKLFNLYKLNSKSNFKGVIKMKTFIKFMKPKTEDAKPNPFNKFVIKTIKPAIDNIEFDSIEDVKNSIQEAIDKVKSDNSVWTIEENTKTPGLVVKNTFQREGKEYPSHNIFFVNVVQTVES